MTGYVTQNISRQLYYYMCNFIVGTEDHVKHIRLLNAVRDDLSKTKELICITSGSFGEGLKLRGSDLDIMFVHRFIEVYDDVKPRLNEPKLYASMDTEDVKPGFTQLRLNYGSDPTLSENCKLIANKKYLSSKVWNQTFMNRMPLDANNIIHGPCISDSDGNFDFAHCLHCKTWVPAAVQWITRSNNSWPGYAVKQSIMRQGILFVPIGVKGSPKEDLEWRMSFSIGEKLLINTFTHTQLVCYALMKILLKDVIDTSPDCKDLLCSYFIKTNIFWISEELPPSEWKPENLIPCFMQCFSRLIYCVEYSICLHYFIPENNMFENKIEGRNRKVLLEKLYTMHSYGWRCILFSDQLSFFPAVMRSSYIAQYYSYDLIRYSYSSLLNRTQLLFQTQLLLFTTWLSSSYIRAIQQSISLDQSLIKYFYSYYMSMTCSSRAQSIPLNRTHSNNKYQYQQYTSCLCTLLQNIYHDAVSGWLMLASFFYKTKQYAKALRIIMYSLSKCTFEKLYWCMKISDIPQQWLELKSVQNMSIVHLWKIFLVDYITFRSNSFLFPDELPKEMVEEYKIVSFPSSAYAYFLNFLCHYHLNNGRQCQDDLDDLRLVIEEHYLMTGLSTIASAHNLLGVALQISGDAESAQRAFLLSFINK